tara:strand:+ start:3406 stop:5271 length:1866 start_codon:yes stop_codon:yes gene_type:complete
MVTLCIPFTLGEIDNYNNYSNLEIDVDFSTSIDKSGGEISYILAKLNFYPKSFDKQVVTSQLTTSTPPAVITENEGDIEYLWETESSNYEFGVESTVTTTNQIIEVYDKISYPTPYDSSLAEYTLPSDFIDINDDIETLAEEIIGGEDDLYKAMFKLAAWTEANIAYNLTTITADAVKPSSWVLENKQGVCDELTNLFISLARSRGIPARFISGLVYTNTINDFGAHGWAEVYIDGKWIPVDVTFGTFGWVDPGHVKFRHSVDSGDSSVGYEWIGNNVDINTNEIDISASVVSASGTMLAIVEMEVEALQNNVGPGSYVPIQITVKNPYEYYLPLKLIVTTAPNLEEDNTKSILLEPNEETVVFWQAILSRDTQPGYQYTTVIEIQTMLGQSASAEINYGDAFKIITQEESEDIIDLLSVDEDQDYLQDLDLDCALDQEIYYNTDNATITCSLSGNLNNVEVCFLEDCQIASSTLIWSLNLIDYESQKLLILANKDEQSKAEYIDLYVITEAEIIISDIEPTSLSFNELTDLSFKIESTEPVYNLETHLENFGTIKLTELDGVAEVDLSVLGKQFYNGNLNFTITYEDQLAKSYTTTQSETIIINDIPWYYKFVIWLQNLF